LSDPTAAVCCNSHLMSDDARFYWGIGREFASHRRRCMLKGIVGKRLTYRRTAALAAWLLHRAKPHRATPKPFLD
jgi:hypothetical protein